MVTVREVFLNPEQVAELLGLSAYTVRAYARQGVLPGHKVGRSWRFSRADVEDWVFGGRKVADPDLMVARDSATVGSTLDSGGTDERKRAIETLDAIRSRARRGSLQAILQESRRDLRGRGRTGDEER